MEPVGHPSTSPVATIHLAKLRFPCSSAGGIAPAGLTFTVWFCSVIATHEARRAVRGGCGARRRAGGGGQALMRGSVVQGPVTGEGRGRWLVLIQAAPQAGGLQAERAAGGGAWARVQRRAQPVQRATAAIRHLEEGQPLNQRSPPSLPGGWRPISSVGYTWSPRGVRLPGAWRVGSFGPGMGSA